MKSADSWIITGSTSIVAQEFAHLAAKSAKKLILVGRNSQQLALICSDIHCRYQIQCEYFVQDFNEDISPLLTKLAQIEQTNALFLAHADTSNNSDLNKETINRLITVNIQNTVQLIHQYWQQPQSHKNIIYISSVAANTGRSKNSLYGATKAAVEIYLQGLQQECSKHQHILIARAGFIDTRQTFGMPGIFHAAKPSAFAKRLWRSNQRQRHHIYFPRFWRFIMLIFSLIPWPIYKKMNKF